MDAALANGPGPLKATGDTAQGYPVDQVGPDKGYFGGYFPQQPVNHDVEHGRKSFCCGCSKWAAIITSVLLALLLLAGVGLGVGLGLGLHKSDNSPPPPPPPVATPPAVPSNERPKCTSDQGCFSRDAGDLCVAGVCGNQWRDAFTCNSTDTGTRRCYSGVCGDVGVLGVANPVDPFACLMTNGNRCQRSEACASQVCKSLGSGVQSGQYCVPKSGATDQPPAAYVADRPCRLDIHCGGPTARCLQGKCSTKADSQEPCTTGASCFSGECVFNAPSNSGDVCAIDNGGFCGVSSDYCKKGSVCSSAGYCTTTSI